MSTPKKYVELGAVERDCTIMVIEGGVPVVLLEDIKALNTYESIAREGIWIPVEEYAKTWGVNVIHHYECSNCGNYEYTNNIKYCPECGAKMRRDMDQCHLK